jgi:Meiotically up-regulated gene 113
MWIAQSSAMCVIICPRKRAEDSSPLPATTSRGSVQQGLSVAGGALGFFQLDLATDKHYLLDRPAATLISSQNIMNRDQILAKMRVMAEANNGEPMGERSFQNATGITRNQFWKAGFAKYNDAVETAGLVANKFKEPLDTSAMLDMLVALTRDIGRFPTKGHLKVARAQNPAFPGYETFLRLAGGAFTQLPGMLVEYCQSKGLHDVLLHIPSSAIVAKVEDVAVEPKSARVVGYVYMVKHERHFKIGRSNDVTRRRREISLLLPNELEHIHVIETDDPEGIELYWHRRFEARRTRGEWFDLKPEDIAAFRRRRYQ